MSALRGYGHRLQSVFPPGFDSVPSSSTAYSKHYTHSTEQLKGVLIDNYDALAPSESIVVKSAWYGKQTSAPRHEFLLIHFEDEREAPIGVQPMFNYLVLDRNVVGKQTKSRKASKQSNTSIQGTQPIDEFKVSYDGDSYRLLEDCNLHPHRLIERLEFSPDHPLRLYELAVLAHLVSRQNPDYRAANSNCYLFAGLIWDSLCELYPGAIRHKQFERERGKHGLYRYVITQPQVAATCKKALEEISDAEAKIKGRKSVGSFGPTIPNKSGAHCFIVAQKVLEAYVRNQIATSAQRGASQLPSRGFTV